MNLKILDSINKACMQIKQNKNMMMLVTVGIYILSLYALLSGHLLLISGFITLLFIALIITNLFPVKYVLIWMSVFYLGIANLGFRLKEVNPILSIAPLNSEVSGTIVSIPQGKTEGKLKFFFRVKELQTDTLKKTFNGEKILVTVNLDDKNIEKSGELKIHNSYKLKGRLSFPFKAGNPSQFDYGNYLRNHDAYAVFYAKDFSKIDSNISLKARLMQNINNYREHIISIHSKYLPSPNLEILGGIVFGDDAVSPPKNIKQSFVNSGLLHILAASGMNVAFIYTFFFFFMSIFKMNYKLKVVLGMLMVVIYTMMTGLGASVIRASAMLLFVLAGKLIDRDAHSVSLLSFVALLMLLYNPMYINEVGFQLSFIVTLGLLVTAPLFMRKNKILNFIISTVSIPIIAQLWVIPIQIFYFNNISIYSVFANIMSVPVLMVLSFGGFVSSLLSLITPIADFICKTFDFVLNPLTTLLVNISEFWGNLPNATIQTTHPAPYQIILYYGILLVLTGLLNKDFREKFAKILVKILLVLTSILLITLIPIKNSNLEITAFDVGSADAFMIKTPKNEYLMIDSGRVGYKGGKSQAEIIILKYLKDIGIRSLNSLIVTHFDNDHCGGAVDLLKNLKVGKIYVNELEHPSKAAKLIYATADAHDVEVLSAKSNQIVYDNDGLCIKNFILDKGKDDNENSIITLLEYNNFRMLFTGDASAESLEEIINNIPSGIDVLKVPHHGAIGGLNENLIKRLQPKYSIISVGENKFGHPSIFTLNLLEGSNILRTDIDNAIKISVKKDKYEIQTFDSDKKEWKKFLKY